MQVRALMDARIHTHNHRHTHRHTHVRARTHTHARTHIHKHTHARTHTNTHTHRHTHTQPHLSEDERSKTDYLKVQYPNFVHTFKRFECTQCRFIHDHLSNPFLATRAQYPNMHLFGDDTLMGSVYLACFVIQIMEDIVAVDNGNLGLQVP